MEDDLEGLDDLERGPLARTFWETLSAKLAADPRLQAAAEREGFHQAVAEETQKICRDVSSSVLATLLGRAPQMLDDHRQERTRFQKALKTVWGEALNLLEILPRDLH